LRPLRQGSLPAQQQLEAAVWPQDLHALIAPVSHVDVTLGVYRDARRPVELALALPGLAKAGHELAFGGEFLDAVIAPVSDIDIALGVHSYAPGEVKLAILRAGLTPL